MLITPGRTTLPPLRLASLAALFMLLAWSGTAAAQTAADSTVTLLWTATGDDGTTGTATTYDLRYRTVNVTGTDTLSWWNAATSVSGLPTPHASGATDSVRVRGLTPLTTYYFILRVADEVPNWSTYSNIAVKATTGDATAPAGITTLALVSVTGTSMTVRWNAPGDDGSTGTATSYDIRYSTSAITSANFGSATQVTGEPTPLVAGTQQSFTISGLSGSRTYYVAMKATDDAGNVSVLSNVVSGTTSDTVPPAAVRDLGLGPDSEPVGPVTVAGTTELALDAR